MVEDIDDGRVVFEISSWPQVDRGGRLHFEGEPSELYDDLAVAQEVIDEARSTDGVTGSDRPSRVGDVFLVKDLAPGADSITSAGTIRDVSLTASPRRRHSSVLLLRPCQRNTSSPWRSSESSSSLLPGAGSSTSVRSRRG